ncbi:MAG: NAD(+)/NADH kinase [Lachnospiraceae bacterium]|nr:NAD(+)/NADH kinase [Lachnospiraceae bacterium]
MKNFLIIANEYKDPEAAYTRQIMSYLGEHGARRVISMLLGDESRDRKIDIPYGIEAILVLGGDGTMLQAARATQSSRVPLLGVNLGTLGYLTEVETDDIENAIDRLMRDDYVIEERMMLKGIAGDHVGSALNDIVVTRTGKLQIIRFDVYVNGILLNSFVADGIICATPTGSTSYSLSAGGPVVEPGARTILLTPICAHTFHSRSIVLSPEDEVVIELCKGSGDRTQTAEVSFDGTDNIPLEAGDRVTITRAVETAKIIKLSQESFLNVLSRKMSGN